MTIAFTNSTNKLFNIFFIAFILFPIIGVSQGPLATGDIYKLRINTTGVYKIDKSLLDELGVSTSGLNPNDISLFGFGFGMMPQANSEARPSELLEVPLKFIGSNNDVFQESDYFIFYGEGADNITYNSQDNFFDYELNLYDVANFYFLRIKGGTRSKNINEEIIVPTNPANVNSLVQVYHHELEEVTALPDASGRYWFGEDFNTTTTKSVNVPVNNNSLELILKVGVMAKSREESTFKFAVGSTTLGEINVRGAKDYESYRYGRQGYMENTTFEKSSVSPNSGSFSFTIDFSKPQSDSQGYLDYLTLNTSSTLSKDKVNLVYYGIMNESNDGAKLSTNLEYNFIWDITDLSNITEIKKNSNQILLTKKEAFFTLLCFDNGDLSKPEFVEKIVNQDLRSMNTPHLLIVTTSQYLDQANRLASHRKSNNSIDVEVVEVSKIYNEFSSGRQDITAIRDFGRALYLKNSNLKSLLLFGQGSYDYKGIKHEGSSQVPIYESREVLERTKSFSSDDYFGFYDEDEGYWAEDIDGRVDADELNIGIGRLPSRNLEEAQTLVDKIIYYDTSKVNTTSWKKNIVFVADDGDGNTHQRDANDIAVYVEENFSDLNSQRLFIDNQPKESTPSGAKSPETNTMLTNWIEKEGTLIVNYSGHGSTTNWAEEAILTSDMVKGFKNNTQLPLFFTATCEFGRYDNPAYYSSAERLLFNKEGGSTVLLTTTRPVYASSNKKINLAFFQEVFKKDQNGKYSSLGDVFKVTKNNSLTNDSGRVWVNNRNFALLGDPSSMLDLPEKEIKIIAINDKVLTANDTIKALDHIVIKGAIEENNVIDTSFDGELYLTLFEKPTISETRGNDGPETVYNYQERKYQLFRGVTQVQSGEFEISFVVPKDIRYAFGPSKFSFYANTLDKKEAIGSNVDIILGGTSNNPVDDDVPPEIELSIYSDQNNNVVYPDTYITASLFDESGINISGIGAGHDLRLILNNEDSSWIINDYLTPVVDKENTYSLVFPLNDLPEGENTLTLEAWDVANNRSEKTISFYVSPISEVEIKEFIAFPNPVENDVTIRIDHNLIGQDLEVGSKIISMNGNIVASNDFTIENSDSIIDLSYQGLRTNYNLISGIYVVQVLINCPTLGIKTYQTTRIVLY